MVIIHLRNNTQDPIEIPFLTLPNHRLEASQEVELTQWNRPTDIMESNELHDLIATGNVTLIVGETEITDEGSLVVLGSPSLFGTEHAYVQSSPMMATVRCRNRTKASLNVNLLGGTYRIGWSFEVGPPDVYLAEVFVAEEVLAEVGISDAATPVTTKQKVARQNTIKIPHVPCKPAKKWHGHSGFKYATLAQGPHTIGIRFGSTNRSTVYMRRARIEIWRVA